MKLVKHAKATFLASSVALANTAFAAAGDPPPAVMTEINNTGSMLIAVITAVVVAFVGFWGMRKLGSKMGWA